MNCQKLIVIIIIFIVFLSASGDSLIQSVTELRDAQELFLLEVAVRTVAEERVKCEKTAEGHGLGQHRPLVS